MFLISFPNFRKFSGVGGPPPDPLRRVMTKKYRWIIGSARREHRERPPPNWNGKYCCRKMMLSSGVSPLKPATNVYFQFEIFCQILAKSLINLSKILEKWQILD